MTTPLPPPTQQFISRLPAGGTCLHSWPSPSGHLFVTEWPTQLVNVWIWDLGAAEQLCSLIWEFVITECWLLMSKIWFKSLQLNTCSVCNFATLTSAGTNWLCNGVTFKQHVHVWAQTHSSCQSTHAAPGPAQVSPGMSSNPDAS